MQKLCEHGRAICFDCAIVGDAARRAYDIVNSYVHFVPWDERINSWIAIRLSDGGSDGVLYQSKRDAVRHQPDEFMCAYFSYRTAPNGFGSKRDAQLWMDITRAAYDAGMRSGDPDAASGGPDLILPTGIEHVYNQLGRLNARSN